MCAALPSEGRRVTNGQAEVLYEGQPRRVQTPGFPDLAAGDYVTIYAGTMLQRLTAGEAEEVLRLFAELMAQEDATDE